MDHDGDETAVDGFITNDSGYYSADHDEGYGQNSEDDEDDQDNEERYGHSAVALPAEADDEQVSAHHSADSSMMDASLDRTPVIRKPAGRRNFIEENKRLAPQIKLAFGVMTEEEKRSPLVRAAVMQAVTKEAPPVFTPMSLSSAGRGSSNGSMGNKSRSNSITGTTTSGQPAPTTQQNNSNKSPLDTPPIVQSRKHAKSVDSSADASAAVNVSPDGSSRVRSGGSSDHSLSLKEAGIAVDDGTDHLPALSTPLSTPSPSTRKKSQPKMNYILENKAEVHRVSHGVKLLKEQQQIQSPLDPPLNSTTLARLKHDVNHETHSSFVQSHNTSFGHYDFEEKLKKALPPDSLQLRSPGSGSGSVSGRHSRSNSFSSNNQLSRSPSGSPSRSGLTTPPARSASMPSLLPSDPASRKQVSMLAGPAASFSIGHAHDEHALYHSAHEHEVMSHTLPRKHSVASHLINSNDPHHQPPQSSNTSPLSPSQPQGRPPRPTNPNTASSSKNYNNNSGSNKNRLSSFDKDNDLSLFEGPEGVTVTQVEDYNDDDEDEDEDYDEEEERSFDMGGVQLSPPSFHRKRMIRRASGTNGTNGSDGGGKDSLPRSGSSTPLQKSDPSSGQGNDLWSAAAEDVTADGEVDMEPSSTPKQTLLALPAGYAGGVAGVASSIERSPSVSAHVGTIATDGAGGADAAKGSGMDATAGTTNPSPGSSARARARARAKARAKAGGALTGGSSSSSLTGTTASANASSASLNTNLTAGVSTGTNRNAGGASTGSNTTGANTTVAKSAKTTYINSVPSASSATSVKKAGAASARNHGASSNSMGTTSVHASTSTSSNASTTSSSSAKTAGASKGRKKKGT